MHFIYFLISLVTCKVITRNAGLARKLEPKMYQLSTKMAEIVPFVHKNELSDYIFQNFAKPSMKSFVKRVKIPEMNQKSVAEKYQFAKEFSTKLESDFNNHLTDSLHAWIESLKSRATNTYSTKNLNNLAKRDEEDVSMNEDLGEISRPAPSKRKKNTWGFLTNDNRGRYISNVLYGLLTVPLWAQMISSGWGFLVAMTLFQNVFIGTVWNRMTFGSW